MKYKILVIDDEPDICEIVKTFLQEFRYDITVALGGEEGLSVLKTLTPSLILLDITMPRMDGMEVLEKISRDKRLAKVPVVMLTAIGRAQTMMDAEKTGAVDYLIKPIVREDLLEVVRKNILPV